MTQPAGGALKPGTWMAEPTMKAGIIDSVTFAIRKPSTEASAPELTVLSATTGSATTNLKDVVSSMQVVTEIISVSTLVICLGVILHGIIYPMGRR